MQVIGIDLGTTNTVMATKAKVRRLDPHTGVILPSVVAYPPHGGRLVGSAARQRRSIDAENTIFSAKRIMGQRWHSPATKEFRNRYPFKLVETAEGLPAFQTRAGEFTPRQIAAAVLEQVREASQLDFSTTAAVIAVPSLFREPQVAATIAAAKLAGVQHVEIIREPVATAAAHLSRKPQHINLAAVYDLGGGTFDMAVVDCAKEPFEILAHGGDIFLGGDDVDLGLAQWAVMETLQQHRWDLTSDPEVFMRLVAACEDAKIALAKAPEATLKLHSVDPSGPLHDATLTLTREELAKHASQLVRKTFIICDEVLMQVGIGARSIDAVFLAGGATQLEVVQEGVRHYFGRDVELAFDPMHVVALGAMMKGEHEQGRWR